MFLACKSIWDHKYQPQCHCQLSQMLQRWTNCNLGQKNDQESAAATEVFVMATNLLPKMMQSLASHPFHKLEPRFYGPFQVLAKVGSVAYKLQLPEHSKLHPVFYVSCLKKHLGVNVQPTVPLPVTTDSRVLQVVPVAILARRIIKKSNTVAIEVLVQWQNTPRRMLPENCLRN